MSSVCRAVRPCDKVRLVSTLFARITSLDRLVRPAGRETFVRELMLRSKKPSFVRVAGRLKALNRFTDKSRLVNLVRLAGKLGFASRFPWRLSETRLLLNSSPARLVMLRPLASRLVRLSRS